MNGNSEWQAFVERLADGARREERYRKQDQISRILCIIIVMVVTMALVGIVLQSAGWL